MKKSFIIIILLIYLSSIMFIGFFGMQLTSYEQTFYVEQIQVINENYNPSTNRLIMQYQPYNLETDLFNPNVVQLEWRFYPENASNRIVTFSSDHARASVNSMGIVTFSAPGTANITIRSTDGSEINKSIIVWFQ
ncbi:MAG: Ig-like domain-containing protein [Clostridia bacterium]|nr:Ig-like domain-containing protein [Clostridia bacterium]